MSRSPTPDALRVWRSLLRYQRVTVAVLDDELRSARSMSLDEYDVLVQLFEAPGRALRMGELVASTLIARSSCTRVVERLVSAGFVERSSAVGDRRTVVVQLTVEGHRALRRAAVTHLDGIRRRFASRLDADDLDGLRRVLDKLEFPAPDPPQ